MSQANRLKLKKGRELQRKQKYKHGETKKTGSAKRGYRTLYWNQKTGSWQSTKPAPLIRKVEVKKEKPKTRAEKLEDGMATWNTKSGNEALGAELPGSKMVKETENTPTEAYKPRNEAKVIKDKNKKTENTPTTTAYKPRNEAKVIKDKQKKGKETLKAKPKKMHAIEKRNRKRFGDAHVDKLKAQYKAFKERRKKKKV